MHFLRLFGWLVAVQRISDRKIIGEILLGELKGLSEYASANGWLHFEALHTSASRAVHVQGESWRTRTDSSIVCPGANITAAAIVNKASVSNDFRKKRRTH